jgi:tetratricopeptide (TPR) repeat protein
VTDHLRALWDFADLDASERRFRERLSHEPHGSERAELLTQLARVQGLRGEFDEGERLLEEAEALAGSSPAALVRIELERGRLRRSSGDPQAALPRFEAAYEAASTAGELFLAADAAHMAALAAPSREEFVTWTKRGIRIAESGDESAAYWLGPLLNNLGWEHYDAGEHEEALDAFERALRARERDAESQEPIQIARYAVAKALRALGRPAEAIGLMEQAVAWTEAEGTPDGWFHEELAEDYAALGRASEAAAQATRALALLPDADPAFEQDGDRAQRLRGYAEGA